MEVQVKEIRKKTTHDKRQNEKLPGNYLLLAGDALNYRLPMSANHIARYLGEHCERLDVVGFISSYGGPPASSGER